jgi:translation initiation factor IF-1
MPPAPTATLKEKEQALVMEGTVEEALPNAVFAVRLDTVDHVVIAYLSGSMRRHRVRILPGDHVRVEISPYDLRRGRIVYRLADRPHHGQGLSPNRRV